MSFFVFGGIIFLSYEERDSAQRSYTELEKSIRKRLGNDAPCEIKASTVSKEIKQKLFRATNKYIRFGVVIYQKNLMDRIYTDKKTRQRYLDYAFKVGVKSAFKRLIRENIINADDVKDIEFYQDEHTTATNGRYELGQALEQEFKIGTFNMKWDVYHEPIFKNLNSVRLYLCNSEHNSLIRASDAIANRIYNHLRVCRLSEICDKALIKELP